MACWSDSFVILPSTYARDLRVTPNVSIEISRAGGPWELLTSTDGDESDQGIKFVTTASATFLFRSKWCATWLGSGPAESAVALRFHIRTLRGTSIYTPIPNRSGPRVGS